MRSSFRAFTVSKRRRSILGVVGLGWVPLKYIIHIVESVWSQGSVQKEKIVGGVLQKLDGIDFTVRRVSVRREISISVTQEGSWYK